MKAKIVLLPGDGIGPEVTAEAELLIMAVAELFAMDIELESALIGAV